MTKKIKNIILILIGVILIFGLGYFIGKNSALVVDENVIKERTKQEILSDLRQKLSSKIEKNLLPVPAYFEQIGEKDERTQTFLYGEILAMDTQNNVLKVQVSNRYESGDFFNYLNEPDYYIKIVKIDEETKIIKQESKDRDEYLEKLEEYKKNREGLPPSPYIEIAFSIGDLKEGREVTVETGSEFRLKEDKVLQAKKIIITE